MDKKKLANMQIWNAAEFIYYIDNQFKIAKKENRSRMSIEWGQWSRAMNLILRDRIKSGDDPEELRLKYVIFYWTLVSQVLELYFQKAVLHHGKIKRRKKEIDNIRKMVLTGKGLTEFEINDPKFIKKMMN